VIGANQTLLSTETKENKPLAKEEKLKLALPKRVFDKLQKLKAYMGPENASVETLEAFEKVLDIANREYEKKFYKRPAQDLNWIILYRSHVAVRMKFQI
jgi:hypothetical protein